MPRLHGIRDRITESVSQFTAIVIRARPLIMPLPCIGLVLKRGADGAKSGNYLSGRILVYFFENVPHGANAAVQFVAIPTFPCVLNSYITLNIIQSHCTL